MKKKDECSLIATAEFTPPFSLIKTPVSLSSVKSGSKAVDAIAVWDTGSEYSGISKRLVKLLGLKKPVDVLEKYPDGKVRKLKAYWVNITFPNGREAHTMATAHESETIDFIIGMNMIRWGTFLLEPLPDEGMRFTFTVDV